jgi:two-component system chemotaxis response regulator CheB
VRKHGRPGIHSRDERRQVAVSEAVPRPGSPRRRIVVIGASAGGVAALISLVERLPADLAAAVFIVLHMPGDSSSSLADILDRAGPLTATAAVDGDPISPGTIVVAPPDNHIWIDDGHVRVSRGPKVNGHRPSVDVLFHSAARAFGDSTVGIVLTGSLSDGALGLRAIARRGGASIVQSDALHQGMPSSALAHAAVDAVLPLQEIPDALTMLIGTSEEGTTSDPIQPDSELESGFDLSEAREPPGAPSIFRCPECGGALWELEDGDVRTYACHVGHTYSADAMVSAQNGSVERALWTAVRMLDEKAVLAARLSDRMRAVGNPRSSAHFADRADEAARQADLVRGLLTSGKTGLDVRGDDVAGEAVG